MEIVIAVIGVVLVVLWGVLSERSTTKRLNDFYNLTPEEKKREYDRGYAEMNRKLGLSDETGPERSPTYRERLQVWFRSWRSNDAG